MEKEKGIMKNPAVHAGREEKIGRAERWWR
jgi:hypothetical protein